MKNDNKLIIALVILFSYVLALFFLYMEVLL